jgi:hypothetical protein
MIRADQSKLHTIIIISIIVIISISSIPIGIYAYSAIRNLLDLKSELPCEVLPDIETVREIVENHQDVIEEIENISPGYVWVEINERCDGKGELYIYYDTIDTKKEILDIIGTATFFGIPYRLFNV